MIATAPQRKRQHLLKARYVFPVTGPPIADGAVAIEGGRIVAVGKPRTGRETVDLGNTAILPGFVNAHTHLEFSDLEKPLGSQGIGFVDWIRAVIELRCHSSPDSGPSVSVGLWESIDSGTTTIGEISQPPRRFDPPQPNFLGLTVFWN